MCSWLRKEPSKWKKGLNVCLQRQKAPPFLGVDALFGIVTQFQTAE